MSLNYSGFAKILLFFSLQIPFSNIGTIVICCDRTSVEEVQDLKHLLRSLKFLTADWFPSEQCLNCSKAVTGDKKKFVSNTAFGSLEITTLKEAWKKLVGGLFYIFVFHNHKSSTLIKKEQKNTSLMP